MENSNLENLYTKIAQKAIEMIPDEWTIVYLYGEIVEDVGKVYFYYYPINSDVPVYFYDIPEKFDINEEQFDLLWNELLDGLQNLWEEFNNFNQETWTNLTLVFDNKGDFKIHYDYEDLSDADDNERSIIWEYKYLGIVPDDKEDRLFLDDFLKNNK
ncbi:antitoxin YezG family protein [Metabacillus idriensis]|uniref:antitoxin YezG family protein n=1 Tax=Metabacillus idriensis TaxID=324768 RepID=UPI00174C4002|nr:antitoxin YezG family protein [Metabacillus idriensis]